MRKIVLALCGIFTLGIFGVCYADDAAQNINKSTKKKMPVQLNEILSVGENLSPSVGYLSFSTSGTIHFLKAYYYDSTNSDCTGTLTLLGAASVVDNGSGFPFFNGQTVSFNGEAAYTLSQNVGQAITDSSVKCMKFFMSGGNATTNTTSCISLPVTCTPSTCTTSNTTPQVTTWDAANGVCTDSAGPTVAPYLYIVDRAPSNSAVRKCSFTSDTVLDCVDSGAGVSFTNTYDIAIGNGYAYVVTYSGSPGGGAVTKCIVNAADGTFSGCTSSQISTGSNTQYTGVEVSGGYIYVLNDQKVDYSAISASDGSFPASATGVTLSATPYGISINNGIAFVRRTSSVLSYYNVSSVNGSLTLGGTALSISGLISNVATRNNMAYFTEFSGAILNYCTNTNGVLSGCTPISLASLGASGVLNLVIKGDYIYISGFNGSGGLIIACPINGDGTITGVNCSLATVNKTGFSQLTSPYGMAVY